MKKIFHAIEEKNRKRRRRMKRRKSNVIYAVSLILTKYLLQVNEFFSFCQRKAQVETRIFISTNDKNLSRQRQIGKYLLWTMLHAGIEALFGRNHDHRRKRSLFRFLRRHQSHKDEVDELATLFLDKPNAEKTTLNAQTFGFASMQGWRSSMEDRHKHLIPFDDRSWQLWSYFSIFDGHNGWVEIIFLDR